MVDFVELAQHLPKGYGHNVIRAGFILGGQAEAIPRQVEPDASAQAGYLIHAEEFNDPAEAHTVYEWRKELFQQAVAIKSIDLPHWLMQLSEFDDQAWSAPEIAYLGYVVTDVLDMRAVTYG
jgi:hypothetical protein